MGNNHSKSQMNATTTIESSLKSSSSSSAAAATVFSTYPKDSYQKQQQLQMHHKPQQQHSQNSLSHQMPPTPPSTSAAANTTQSQVHIPYNIDWVFEGLRKPSKLWYICSQLAILAVGLFSKFVLGKQKKKKRKNNYRMFIAIMNSSVIALTSSIHWKDIILCV